MNPATIYHRPLSEYAFALDDTHYVFRLRTGKGEAVSCKFYYADRAIMTPELEFFCVPMEKFREDQYFDWYEIQLETGFERPEVLLCSNNHLALHCLQYIRRLGLKVPEEIALLTFDNYPFSMLTDPAITAVEVDMHEMGINAARFVLQRIRKPNLQTQSYCTSPCILEREST